MFRKGMDLLTIDTSWSPSQIISGQGKLLIVEGMSSTLLEKELFDLSIFCYTDNETELQRRLQRDTSERGCQARFVMQSHQQRRRQYQLYLEPFQKNCEFLLNQSQNKCLLERKT
ncbi:uridine kinase [Streptococcus dysgalactiae subsp. dysgalactiae]|uniref:phosphoribulokinase n=1 Tax=Streptococcus dysgalactiae TaxID=1334 RepID=UPI000F704806|nr:phosphoribulokinase [Streptococcus dysgalactiae]VDZ40626.1 uridine kinase [Streptococcus dysgalactiae subsp. dysgalactiae]